MSEQDPRKVVTIPGTNLRAGIFDYRATEDEKNLKAGDETRKAGILVPGDALYYAENSDAGGDCNFGVYKNHFLMDCTPYGTSHGRLLYHFKFGKKIEFLGFGGSPTGNFATVSVEEKKPGFERSGFGKPVWMDIKDIDNNGFPEIAYRIIFESMGPDEFDVYADDVFIIYHEIKGDDLSYNLNPGLYKPLFEEEKNKGNTKTSAYYIYGFLSRAMTLDKIKAELTPDEKKYDTYEKRAVLRGIKGRYEMVVRFLKSITIQNPNYKVKNYKAKKSTIPILKRYDLKKAAMDMESNVKIWNDIEIMKSREIMKRRGGADNGR